jgi:hypothetical protein
MPRSTKAGKARQLNAGYAMLLGNVPLPEAMQRLSREFDLSERQAYRYLEEAQKLDRPIEVCEATVPITLKLPVGTSRLAELREKQWADYPDDRYPRFGCVCEYAEKVWVSRAKRAARLKLGLTMCLIACTMQSSPRPTVFCARLGTTCRRECKGVRT